MTIAHCLCLQILECVAINLTLVYAILSYSAVKKLMAATEQNVSCRSSQHCYIIYRCCETLLMWYCIAGNF